MALNADSGTLARIQREHGREFAEGWLTAWLVSLNRMLSLKRPLTEEQIELAAFEICEEFYCLKITDLTFLSRRIINGEYGEFYESLSISKIVSFFREYFNERCETAAQESQTAHLEDKALQDNLNVSRNTKRIIQFISEKSSHGKPKH